MSDQKISLNKIECEGIDKDWFLLPKIFKIPKYVIETEDSYLFDYRASVLPIIIWKDRDLKQYLHEECNETMSMEASEFHWEYVDSTNRFSVRFVDE